MVKKTKTTIEEGDIVIVDIPFEDYKGDKITPKLRQLFNGEAMVVTKKVKLASNQPAYFELADAVSEAGVHYTFMANWLKKEAKHD